MNKIFLTGIKGKDKFCLVDKEDFETVNSWKWNLVANRYAKHTLYLGGGRKNEKKKNIGMHRFIMQLHNIDIPKDMVIDHINGNGLDNRKSNMRIITQHQNSFNSKVRLSRSKSGFKGVSLHPLRNKKWLAQIQFNGKFYFLGWYFDKKDAAKAYNEGATKYFGKYAKLNIL